MTITSRPFAPLLTVLLLASGAANSADSRTATPSPPRNVILMVGDGMGFGQIAAYRQFADNPATPARESTVFDDILIGSIANRPAGEPDRIIDSAAGATAYSCGIRTYNGAIGVDASGKPCQTVLELAKQRGLRTGIVATSQLSHATPASFFAHVGSRKQISEIAGQLIAMPRAQQPDVAFGGGAADFSPEAIQSLQQKGVQVVSSRAAVAALNTTPAMALLAPQGLPMAIDRDPSVPSLAELTDKALQLLHRDQHGFFLMVEGSQIDWASHANDIVGTLSEMQDFAAAIAVARRFVSQNPDTLLVITADHETGGLALGRDKQGFWRTALLREVRASAAGMAEKVAKGADAIATLQQLSPISPDETDRAQLLAAGRDADKLEDAFAAVLSRHSLTGWTTTGHTGADVPLFATGAGSEWLRGHRDNDWLGQQLMRWVGESTVTVAADHSPATDPTSPKASDRRTSPASGSAAGK